MIGSASMCVPNCQCSANNGSHDEKPSLYSDESKYKPFSLMGWLLEACEGELPENYIEGIRQTNFDNTQVLDSASELVTDLSLWKDFLLENQPSLDLLKLTRSVINGMENLGKLLFEMLNSISRESVGEGTPGGENGAIPEFEPSLAEYFMGKQYLRYLADSGFKAEQLLPNYVSYLTKTLKSIEPAYTDYLLENSKSDNEWVLLKNPENSPNEPEILEVPQKNSEAKLEIPIQEATRPQNAESQEEMRNFLSSEKNEKYLEASDIATTGNAVLKSMVKIEPFHANNGELQQNEIELESANNIINPDYTQKAAAKQAYGFDILNNYSNSVPARNDEFPFYQAVTSPPLHYRGEPFSLINPQITQTEYRSTYGEPFSKTNYSMGPAWGLNQDFGFSPTVEKRCLVDPALNYAQLTPLQFTAPPRYVTRNCDVERNATACRQVEINPRYVYGNVGIKSCDARPIFCQPGTHNYVPQLLCGNPAFFSEVSPHRVPGCQIIHSPCFVNNSYTTIRGKVYKPEYNQASHIFKKNKNVGNVSGNQRTNSFSENEMRIQNTEASFTMTNNWKITDSGEALTSAASADQQNQTGQTISTTNTSNLTAISQRHDESDVADFYSSCPEMLNLNEETMHPSRKSNRKQNSSGIFSSFKKAFAMC